MEGDPPILDAIAELRAKVDEVLARVRPAHERLYIEIFKAFGSAVFTVAELCDFARLPGQRELRRAVFDVNGSMSGRKLGRLSAELKGERLPGCA